MRRAPLFVVIVGLLTIGGTAMASIPDDASPQSAAASDYVIVSLASPAAASYDGSSPGLAATRPAQGKLDRGSAAYAAYRRHLAQEHANFRSYMRRNASQATIEREYFDVLNGFAIKL